MNEKYHINAENIEELLTDEDDPSKILMRKEEESENINLYREASKRFINIMSLAMTFILESQNKTLATVAVAYALGLSEITNGKSQRQFARELGVSSGTISWQCKEFKKYAKLDI